MRTIRGRRLVVPAALLVAAASLAGCGGMDMGDMDMGDMDMGDMDMGDTGGGHMHGGEVTEPDPVAEGARVIPVVATSFDFAPREIGIAAGEDVAIELESEDVTHDFIVDGPPGHVVAAEAGETATGGMRIDEPGTYKFWCSVSGHKAAGMEGTIVVSPA